MMTATEVNNYLAQGSPTPTPMQTAAPYDPNAQSSYGYVTANSVNFRSAPGGTRIGVLNQYAFGLVLGSQISNGTTWYNVNQSGTVGWVSADFFKVLNLAELSTFLNSSEYLQGIKNSGSSTTTNNNTTSGSATQGQVSSVEDWNVGVWQNPSTSLNATYEPFNPYATPAVPLETATPTPQPTSTFVIGTMIPIEYEEDTKETQSGSGWVGLVLGGIVLIGGAGGVYAYALTQNKKRKAAARAAAARRSQPKPPQDNPYARRAAAAPPTASGQQQPGQTPYQRPNPYAKPQQQAQQNPYAQRQPFDSPKEPAAHNPYARPKQQAPDGDSDNTQSPRTSRRSDRYHNDGDDNA